MVLLIVVSLQSNFSDLRTLLVTSLKDGELRMRKWPEMIAQYGGMTGMQESSTNLDFPPFLSHVTTHEVFVACYLSDVDRVFGRWVL